MYWCHLPKDAELPELWKRRPVIIVSTKNTLHGAVTAIPTTTAPQPDNPWAIQLKQSMVPGKVSWAICDKPLTLATSRLRAERGKIPRLEESEFNVILARLLGWLPKLPARKSEDENRTPPITWLLVPYCCRFEGVGSIGRTLARMKWLT